MSRRYKIDRYPIYDQKFDQHKLLSPIFNDSQRKNIKSAWIQPSTKEGIKTLKNVWLGQSDGKYNDGTKWVLAVKTHAEYALKEINDRIKHGIERDKKEGGEGKADTFLLDQKLEKEAYFDVIAEECEQILKWEQEFITQPAQERKSKNLLRRGPNGTVQLSGGSPREADGQSCGLLDDLPVIIDKDSPFWGMSVSDYKKFVCKPWRKARMILENEYDKLYKTLAKRGEEEKIQQQWSKRKTELQKMHPEWKDIFGQSFRGRKIPSWPEKVKCHLNKKKDD